MIVENRIKIQTIPPLNQLLIKQHCLLLVSLGFVWQKGQHISSTIIKSKTKRKSIIIFLQLFLVYLILLVFLYNKMIDSYTLYMYILQEDVGIMKYMNLDAQRISISWSRILPSELNDFHNSCPSRNFT